MPWLAIPFGDERAKKLEETYEVDGLPALVLLKPDGKVLKEDAAADI